MIIVSESEHKALFKCYFETLEELKRERFKSWLLRARKYINDNSKTSMQRRVSDQFAMMRKCDGANQRKYISESYRGYM